MSERMHVIGECDDARRRRLVREQRHATQWTPGQSFEQWDRQQRLAAGQIDAGSTESLSESERLNLALMREELKAGTFRGVVPAKLEPFVRDLGKTASYDPAAVAQTRRDLITTAKALNTGEIDASTQATEWSRDHAARLARQPLSRELRQALGPHTKQTTAAMLDHFCKQLSYSTSMRLAVSLEAASKGILLDEMTPEPIAMSEDLETVLAGQHLPIHCSRFYERCRDFGYDTHHATVLALEAGPRISYGDARVEVKDTRTLHATGRQKVVDRIQASSGGRCAYDGTGICFKGDTHLAGRPIQRKAGRTYEC